MVQHDSMYRSVFAWRFWLNGAVAFSLLLSSPIFASDCASTTIGGGGNADGTNPPAFEDPYKKSYRSLVSDAIEGKCLKKHPESLWNFYKTLGMVWLFQVGGYLKLERYITGEEPTPAGVNTSEFTSEFPFAVLANTAFIIRLQSEVGCNLIYEQKKVAEEPSYSMTPSAIFQRYRSFAKLTPLAASTAFVSIGVQKLLYSMADELSEKTFGYDLGRYQNPLSLNFVRSVSSETIGIVGFELFFLFPKWAVYETWLMNRGFPLLKGAASSSGFRYAVGSGAEWAYRLGVPILIDNPVLFEMMEHDGLSLGELPFAKYYVPSEKHNLVFFNPDQWISFLMEGLKKQLHSPIPEGTVE